MADSAQLYRTVRLIHSVGGVDDVAGDFSVSVANGELADSDGVVESLTVQLDILDDVRIRRQRRQSLLIGGGFVGRWRSLIFVGLRRVGGCFLVLPVCGEEWREDEDKCKACKGCALADCGRQS